MVEDSSASFSFGRDEAFGIVEMVDTATVVVSVDDPAALARIQVNRLVAILGTRVGELYIGMVSKIVRKANLDDLWTAGDGASFASDTVKVLLVGTVREKDGTKKNVFKRSIASVPTVGAEVFLIEKDRLSSLMGAISGDVGDGIKRLSIGRYAIDEETPAIIDGDKFFQRHAAIVGSTGSGKSWLVAKVIEQVASLDSGNAILFDMHGEYSSLKGDQFKSMKIAGPSGSNPDDELFLPYWLLSHEELMSLMLDRSDQNAPNQAALFTRFVLEGKREYLIGCGHKDEAPKITVDSPVPFSIEALIKKLEDKDVEMVPGSGGKEKQGPYHGKLTRFVQRLGTRVGDKRLNFMFSDNPALSDYDYAVTMVNGLMRPRGAEAGVKVIDFSEVPSDILPLITSVLARLVFTVQQWTDLDQRQPIALFCDEAHLYIPADTSEVMGVSARSSFQRIAKEGRKYGVGLVVISQRPHEVDKTVLSQCNNFLSMRLTNVDDQNTIRRLFPDNLGDLASVLPVLNTGEVVAVGDACVLPSRILVGEPDHKPISATVDFWTTWSSEAASPDYSSSIKALRLQSR